MTVQFAELSAEETAMRQAAMHLLAPQAKASKVGHILSRTYSRVISYFLIIGEYKGLKGDTYYILNDWRADKNQFESIASNSFFLVAISPLPMPLKPEHQAMIRALEYERKAAFCSAIARRYGFTDYVVSKTAQNGANTRFTLQDEYDFDMVDSNATIRQRAKRMRDYWHAKRTAALREAGVVE